jgi:HK97 family phage major capsid protein
MNLQEQIKALLKQARDIAEKAEKEDRDFNADERVNVAKLLEDAKELKEKAKQQEGDASLKQFINELSGEFADQQKDKGAHAPAQPGKGLTFGEQFIESEQWQAWLKQVAPGGRVPDRAKISSPPVEFKHLLKDLVTGADVTSAGAFVQTDYTGIYEPIGRYPLTVMDLIAKRQTGSDLVEFVRQTVQVQEAAAVPESNVTDYTGYPGEVSGKKPEGKLGFEKVQEAVKTIAVWVPATKRALSDAAQIRGIIDQELRDDLNEEMENQIVNGGGDGENFTGILNTPHILTQPFNTNILTTTRQAITSLRVTGRVRPTAWLMNPEDWETIELLQDGEDRYYWGGPMVQGARQLWGYPVVESPVVTAGSCLLGDWRKAVLWDREAANIQVSDSHADFFIRNMVAILAELRAAFGVIRPSAFCEVELTDGS